MVSLDAYLKQHPEKQLTVVDGFLLRADPYGVMAEVLKNMHAPHDDATLDKVVRNWDPKTTRSISDAIPVTGSAYIKKVTNSTGYTPPLDITPPLDNFPPGIQEHLIETVMPAFIDFLRWPHRAGPKTLEELQTILNKKCGEFSVKPEEQQELEKTFGKKIADISLEEINPVTAYALVASLDRNELNDTSLQNITQKLSQLREQFPPHNKAFNIIDRIISGHDKPGGDVTITRIDDGHQKGKGAAI